VEAGFARRKLGCSSLGVLCLLLLFQYILVESSWKSGNIKNALFNVWCRLLTLRTEKYYLCFMYLFIYLFVLYSGSRRSAHAFIKTCSTHAAAPPGTAPETTILLRLPFLNHRIMWRADGLFLHRACHAIISPGCFHYSRYSPSSYGTTWTC